MKEKEKKEELSFEENIKKLEMIVRELESGETPLDIAIDKYKEALEIAKFCDTKLKNATEMVSKIVDDKGNLQEFQIED